MAYAWRLQTREAGRIHRHRRRLHLLHRRSQHGRRGNTPGKKIITSEGDYIWTANFRPAIPIRTTAIRIDAFGNDIYNVRFQSGGTDCEIPAAYRGRVRSLSAYAGNTIAHDQVGAHISMRDEEGAYLGILGVVVFKMNKNPLVDYGYRYTRVLFSVTCLG